MNYYFKDRDTCPLCTSSHLGTVVRWEYTDPTAFEYMWKRWNNKFDKSALANTFYDVKKCTACGFVFQKTVLDENILYSEKIESDEVLKLQSTYRLESRVAFSYFLAREIERAAYFLRKKPRDITILDFGSGLGFWSLCTLLISQRIEIACLQAVQ